VQYAGMKTGASSICVLAFWSFYQIGFADSGDAAAPPTPLDAQIDFILDHPLPESDYSQSDRCVYVNDYEAIEVLDSRRLLFRGRRGSFWLNQLRSECLGLTRDGVLILEGRNRSICDMDSFRSVPRRAVVQMSDLTNAQFAMNCMLGHFEAISEAQAMVLRDALSRPTYRPAQKPKANEDD
jgi:hypothetical protein